LPYVAKVASVEGPGGAINEPASGGGSPEEAVRWFRLCEEFLDHGAVAEALPAAEKGARLDPSVARGHRLVATCLLRLDRGGEAIFAARRAARLAPSDSSTLALLAEAQLASGDHARSWVTAHRAVAGDGMNIDALNVLARVAVARENWGAARSAAGAVLAREPNNASALRSLAVAAEAEKRFSTAARAYARAAELDPEQPEPAQSLWIMRTRGLRLAVSGAYVTMVMSIGAGHGRGAVKILAVVAFAVAAAAAWWGSTATGRQQIALLFGSPDLTPEMQQLRRRPYVRFRRYFVIGLVLNLLGVSGGTLLSREDGGCLGTSPGASVDAEPARLVARRLAVLIDANDVPGLCVYGGSLLTAIEFDNAGADPATAANLLDASVHLAMMSDTTEDREALYHGLQAATAFARIATGEDPP
jgi:tetratricopeptide (TPR) repeat protein